MANTISLLESPNRVVTPFIKVKIGAYDFGIFSESSKVEKIGGAIYKIYNFQYPNYIQELQVKKINGQVNEYTLQIKYPITESSDPNFFEKVFSSVSEDRSIIFSYGDMSAPNFLYKDESAIITKVQNSFDLNSACITYTVSATSKVALTTASAYNFTSKEWTGYKKPSDLIKKILKQNTKFGLLDVFTGMRNTSLVESYGLIASDDIIVNLEAQTNMTALDYIKYLVSSMRRNSDNNLYTITVIDDTSDIFGGPYFKVVNAMNSSNSLDTYELDIGYPSSNIVTSFTIDNNESYSILYNFDKKLNTNEYITRIADDGTTKTIYSPNISSKNDEQITHTNDYNWWVNVTEYPISAVIQIKGILRPAILMSKLKLNVLFYGRAHISSGTYIITKQVDTIKSDGCWTTLNLVRVAGDTENYKEIL